VDFKPYYRDYQYPQLFKKEKGEKAMWIWLAVASGERFFYYF
jgi:hypothetical protein